MVKNRISHTAPFAIALFWFHVDEFLTPASHCTIPYQGAVFTTSHQIILFFFFHSVPECDVYGWTYLFLPFSNIFHLYKT